jgi:hypothetical protein
MARVPTALLRQPPQGLRRIALGQSRKRAILVALEVREIEQALGDEGRRSATRSND